MHAEHGKTYIVKCPCGHEFEYTRNDGEDPKFPDDWFIDCPECKNWEQVGNNKPQNFKVLREVRRDESADCNTRS